MVAEIVRQMGRASKAEPSSILFQLKMPGWLTNKASFIPSSIGRRLVNCRQ